MGVGVTISKPSVKAAREAAAKAMTSIIDAVKALGVDEKDIKTVGLNLYPQYNNSTPARVVGYTLSEQVQVTVRDLDKVGDVADAAMANGATDANGIWFDLADPAKAMDDARAAAVQAAKTSATAMAKAAGVNLGTVISISEPTQVVYPYPYAMASSPRGRARRRHADPGPARHPGRPVERHGRLRDRLRPSAGRSVTGWPNRRSSRRDARLGGPRPASAARSPTRWPNRRRAADRGLTRPSKPPASRQRIGFGGRWRSCRSVSTAAARFE